MAAGFWTAVFVLGGIWAYKRFQQWRYDRMMERMDRVMADLESGYEWLDR